MKIIQWPKKIKNKSRCQYNEKRISKEPEWFDAKKCFPLINAQVAVFFEEVTPNRFEKGQKICFPGRFDGYRWRIFAIENAETPFVGANIMDFTIIKWKYQDE